MVVDKLTPQRESKRFAGSFLDSCEIQFSGKGSIFPSFFVLRYLASHWSTATIDAVLAGK
jgi:hypothetical protein